MSAGVLQRMSATLCTAQSMRECVGVCQVRSVWLVRSVEWNTDTTVNHVGWSTNLCVGQDTTECTGDRLAVLGWAGHMEGSTKVKDVEMSPRKCATHKVADLFQKKSADRLSSTVRKQASRSASLFQGKSRSKPVSLWRGKSVAIFHGRSVGRFLKRSVGLFQEKSATMFLGNNV